ncbi:MAG: M48 family metallopeptidase, partial [Rhodospirillales bacterium]|nr:M48 family metallopeptidase [Rhodospirillales bacterium]
EGINVSRHSPLAEFFILSGGVVVVFGGLAIAALLLGAALARHMPVSWENALAAAVLEDAARSLGADVDREEDEVAAALQALAGRIAARMDLPEGLGVTVHYLEDDQVNAFATLGGHVFFFRGLLQRMPDENALAMVMAHEIAHVANRDPAASLGGTLLLQLVLGVALGSSPESLEKLILAPNALLLTGFSREAERRADRDALAAVAALYGHAAGAATIFEVFLEEAARSGSGEPPAFLSTHPLSTERIAGIRERADARGWPLDGEVTRLPPAIAKLRAAP